MFAPVSFGLTPRSRKVGSWALLSVLGEVYGVKVVGMGRGALDATSDVFGGVTRPECFLWNTAGQHVD